MKNFKFHKSEIRTVLLEVGIVLGLLKKTSLKTSKIVVMYSNSLARHFSSMFHAKCLLPRLEKLLPVRSCLQNFYQCSFPHRINIFISAGSISDLYGFCLFVWTPSKNCWFIYEQSFMSWLMLNYGVFLP